MLPAGWRVRIFTIWGLRVLNFSDWIRNPKDMPVQSEGSKACNKRVSVGKSMMIMGLISQEPGRVGDRGSYVN